MSLKWTEIKPKKPCKGMQFRLDLVDADGKVVASSGVCNTHARALALIRRHVPIGALA